MQQQSDDELMRVQQEAILRTQQESNLMRQQMMASGQAPTSGFIGLGGPPPRPIIHLTQVGDQQQPIIPQPTAVGMDAPPLLRLTPVTLSTAGQQTVIVPVSDMTQPQSLPPPGSNPVLAPPGPSVLLPPGTNLPPGAQFNIPPPQRPPQLPPPTSGVNPPPISHPSAKESSPEEEDDIQLPQALEKALAYKSERAQEVGIKPDEIEKLESHSHVIIEDTHEEEEDDIDQHQEVESAQETRNRQSKNRRRKLKKKRRANNKRLQEQNTVNNADKENTATKEPDVEIEYVQESIDIMHPLCAQFQHVFQAFQPVEPEVPKVEEPAKGGKDEKKEELKKKPKDADDDDDDEEGEGEDEKKDDTPKLSKRKLKKLNRLSIAELKQQVARPDVVEMHDVTARDPKLLVHLKAYRNTVPVPRHWCFKRKYLQGKRGIEKPPFELPDFIKKTGIMEMRQALQEKEDQKTLKSKMRERVRPKLGKIDIDYQKLHDAFFKWQTKPKMSIHGDLYYEGKEFETKLKEKKPGDLSDDLRTALGMPIGVNAQKVPPPWLIAMQRYGPPPSYPNLKIPGLNAPIPESCSFGYHAGGWGKPPVDETGKPLYGDVFGTQNTDTQQNTMDDEIDRTMWGELESESESESEEEEEEEMASDEEGPGEPDAGGIVTPAEGLITPSGLTSIPLGMETPDMIELRKRKIEQEMEGGETPALYTILPEKRGERVGAAMMGSAHTYDVSAAVPVGKTRGVGAGNALEKGIELALDPSELDLDTAAMAARYEQTIREQQSILEKEDLSDMVAEHAAKQKHKRKKQQDTGKQAKKYKEFKF